MIIFIGSGLVIGGLLGARFAVLALIPAAGCALTAAALGWAWQARAPDWSLLHLIVLLVFLEVGYLCGGGLRLFVASSRVPSESKLGST